MKKEERREKREESKMEKMEEGSKSRRRLTDSPELTTLSPAKRYFQASCLPLRQGIGVEYGRCPALRALRYSPIVEEFYRFNNFKPWERIWIKEISIAGRNQVNSNRYILLGPRFSPGWRLSHVLHGCSLKKLEKLSGFFTELEILPFIL